MLKLTTARKQKGISQTQLAKKLGITRNTLNRLERGRFNPELVPWRRALRLAEILERPMEELLSREA